MAIGASSVIKFVEECSQNESLEVGYYLRALRELCSMEVGFKDVQLFLFTRKSSALLNLIGLHYSILSLGIPVSVQIKFSFMQNLYLQELFDLTKSVSGIMVDHCVQRRSI